ncbi:hypothetical protein Bbelb_230740 [Branchiostoma belcheri]|nr:hypothetical protein Bbelb_230740 [Branchiostoma belcheri]
MAMFLYDGSVAGRVTAQLYFLRCDIPHALRIILALTPKRTSVLSTDDNALRVRRIPATHNVPQRDNTCVFNKAFSPAELWTKYELQKRWGDGRVARWPGMSQGDAHGQLAGQMPLGRAFQVTHGSDPCPHKPTCDGCTRWCYFLQRDHVCRRVVVSHPGGSILTTGLSTSHTCTEREGVCVCDLETSLEEDAARIRPGKKERKRVRTRRCADCRENWQAKSDDVWTLQIRTNFDTCHPVYDGQRQTQPTMSLIPRLNASSYRSTHPHIYTANSPHTWAAAWAVSDTLQEEMASSPIINNSDTCIFDGQRSKDALTVTSYQPLE